MGRLVAAIRKRIAGAIRQAEIRNWDWDGEGDGPHRKVCEDGTVITFGIDEGDGILRRAKPEDYPPGRWPPVGVGIVNIPQEAREQAAKSDGGCGGS